jgi:hypothetical protein
VEEKDLRASFREAAAAVSDDGVRLWLYVEGNPGLDPQDLLKQFASGQFVDREPDPDFKDEEVKIVKFNVFDVAVTAFKGKYAKRHESAIDMAGPKGDAKGAGKSAQKTPSSPAAKAADPTVENRVRLALFTTQDRIYVFCLAGPEAPFSKVEAKFDEILNSVRFDLSLMKK